MNLSPTLILSIIIAYFAVLIGISWYTSRNADNSEFFMAGRKSPWWIIAIGMIGTSISGVTFISVPGYVNSSAMSYMQTVLGYMVGYAVIAWVLLPLYYRLHLVSIYGYLEQRFGPVAYKTGSAFFLLSRTVGSSLRLFLMAKVLHAFVFEPIFHIPFGVTVLVTIILIYTYTFKGGIKTIIWTDTLQTLFLISSLILTIVLVGQHMHLGIGDLISTVKHDARSQIFFFEGGWSDPKNFFKQFVAGAFIAIVMSGLDQDIMQKILTVKTLKGAQVNIFSYSSLIVLMNLLFMSLGVLLFIYASQNGIEIPTKEVTKFAEGVATTTSVPDTDLLFPTIAFKYAPAAVGILFILGITASSYASSDSALTSLTTAWCIDFLGFQKTDVNSEANARTRRRVHLAFSAIFFVLIMVFHFMATGEVIKLVFDSASITYGPLLGLFAFGFYTKRQINDRLSLYVCLGAILLTSLIYLYNGYLGYPIFGYKFSFELLVLNGLLTFLGLLAISHKGDGNFVRR
ncbi:MAG: sodium:solute symporter [Bacteroidetes bacterium]|nr:sodium:solute symporter [Bacteroidota bacterium]